VCAVRTWLLDSALPNLKQKKRSPNKYIRQLMRYEAIASYYPVNHGFTDKLCRRLRVEGRYTDSALVRLFANVSCNGP
jgi:hypothetical protein